MDYDPLNYPYPSRRKVVYAKNGMVTTSQPLASQAGLEILQKGGNAIDAAVATAACLTVVEPTSNGIGADAFSIIYSGGRLYGLNSSGPAPKRVSIKALKKKGYNQMPKFGWPPVTVPGAPAAWAKLSQRFGKLKFDQVLKPAIRYAQGGYPISPTLGKYWRRAFRIYRRLEGKEFKTWFDTFAPQGRPPKIGEVWNSPGHAQTLESIAQTESESFYRGKLAERIDSFSRKFGGYLTEKDLADFEPEWVEPIKVDYGGYQVWELPPNGQGLIALMALNILKGFEPQARDRVDTYHKQIEAVKLSFADGKEYITDPNWMSINPENLLAEDYIERRRGLIGDRAITPKAGKPAGGGTVYLATADGQGNMVSYIQSNYMGFGSGLVVPGTGIALQNRGHIFSLDPAAVNCLEPGKRTYHTIIPGFLTKNKQPVGPFGVMGGYMQPQGHVQVMMNALDFELNPQAALDAPRWRWVEGKTVELEHGFFEHIAKALARKGHQIRWRQNEGGFGRGQIIWKKGQVLAGGSDPRADGQVAAW